MYRVTPGASQVEKVVHNIVPEELPVVDDIRQGWAVKKELRLEVLIITIQELANNEAKIGVQSSKIKEKDWESASSGWKGLTID